MARQFVHVIDEENRSIAGWYYLYKEGIIEHNGKRILFLLGEGTADSASAEGEGSVTPWSPEKLLT